jgi:hypothetical protein
MTTNENLLPGTLIEYKTAGNTPATAWLLHHVGGLTPKTIGLRVVGEADEYNKDCNRGVEFTLYVKPRGRAKVIQLPENAPTEKFVPPTNKGTKHVGLSPENVAYAEEMAGYVKPRVASSHSECSHESSKAARAACRKQRAASA